MKSIIMSTENSTTYITTDNEGVYEVPPAKSPDNSIRLKGFWKVFFWLVVIGVHMVAYFGVIY